MSTRDRRPGPLGRRAALATAVIAALAAAAPVVGASAATPVAVERDAAGGEFAFGGLAVADVFNGGTTVVVSTSPAVGTTIDYP
jgi:hypothetical protein